MNCEFFSTNFRRRESTKMACENTAFLYKSKSCNLSWRRRDCLSAITSSRLRPTSLGVLMGRSTGQKSATPPLIQSLKTFKTTFSSKGHFQMTGRRLTTFVCLRTPQSGCGANCPRSKMCLIRSSGSATGSNHKK